MIAAGYILSCLSIILLIASAHSWASSDGWPFCVQEPGYVGSCVVLRSIVFIYQLPPKCRGVLQVQGVSAGAILHACCCEQEALPVTPTGSLGGALGAAMCAYSFTKAIAKLHEI